MWPCCPLAQAARLFVRAALRLSLSSHWGTSSPCTWTRSRLALTGALLGKALIFSRKGRRSNGGNSNAVGTLKGVVIGSCCGLRCSQSSHLGSKRATSEVSPDHLFMSFRSHFALSLSLSIRRLQKYTEFTSSAIICQCGTVTLSTGRASGCSTGVVLTPLGSGPKMSW